MIVQWIEESRIVGWIFGILMIELAVGILIGCGGKDTPTGPQGQTLEVEPEKWDNGNLQGELH